MDINRQLIKKYKEVNVGDVSLPICFHHADGAYLFDHEDNSFLDFTSGFGVTSSGWLRKELMEVIEKQLQRSAYAPPWLPTQEAITLSEQLLEITPPNLVKCARATGGADANEVIFKAVIGSNGRKGIVSFHRSYHGGTHFALNISDSAAFRLPQLPTSAAFHFVEPPYCYRCPFGKEPRTCNLECTQAIETLLEHDKTIGSFFLEPVIGSGGVIIPPRKYLQRIRELCDTYNVFMVFDEVLTGFGRLGSMTASALFDIRPDAISFAKGISGGYTALGAAVLNAELSESIKKYEDVSGSFAWTPLSCCIASANINLIIKGDLPANAANQGSHLLQQVTALFQKYFSEKLGDVRGLGLMIGIELVTDRLTKIPDRKLTQKFIVAALRQGLMICASWDFQVLILMPPLNITLDEINDGIRKLERTLHDVSRPARVVAMAS